MKKSERHNSYLEYSRKKQAIKDAVLVRQLEQKSGLTSRYTFIREPDHSTDISFSFSSFMLLR